MVRIQKIDSNASTAIIASMPTLTIRNLSEETHAKLRIRAAENGRSMEADLRAVIERYLANANDSLQERRKLTIEEIQAMVRQYIPQDVSLVDALVDMRREEARRELEDG